MSIYRIDSDCPAQTGIAPAWVAPSADVIGNVQLGADVSVWFGAVVRADNTGITIGDGSNIQDGAILHSDPGSPLTIGRDVTIGHRAVVHGCKIHDTAMIGMGAIIMNDAEIGEGSIVAAGALVPEGRFFQPRSLIVGIPATFKHFLSDGQVEAIRQNAQAYRDKSAIYRSLLHQIY